MARRARPSVWPPHLARFDPAAWIDRYQWSLARWQFWTEHPELEGLIDPIELLRDRYLSRRAAQDSAVPHCTAPGSGVAL